MFLLRIRPIESSNKQNKQILGGLSVLQNGERFSLVLSRLMNDNALDSQVLARRLSSDSLNCNRKILWMLRPQHLLNLDQC